MELKQGQWLGHAEPLDHAKHRNICSNRIRDHQNDVSREKRKETEEKVKSQGQAEFSAGESICDSLAQN